MKLIITKALLYYTIILCGPKKILNLLDQPVMKQCTLVFFYENEITSQH